MTLSSWNNWSGKILPLTKVAEGQLQAVQAAPPLVEAAVDRMKMTIIAIHDKRQV